MQFVMKNHNKPLTIRKLEELMIILTQLQYVKFYEETNQLAVF